MLRELLDAEGVHGAPERCGRALVRARRSPEPEVDAAGVQGLEHRELLGDDERRVVGEHHAAGTDGDARRGRGEVSDEHRRSGRCHGGHVVVLGDPEALVPGGVGGLGEPRRRGEGLRGALPDAHGSRVEDGQGDAGGCGRRGHNSPNIRATQSLPRDSAPPVCPEGSDSHRRL